MSTINKFFIVMFAVSLLVGCATQAVQLNPSAVMEKYPMLKELKVLLGKAESEGASYLAPAGYERAQEIYKKSFNLASYNKPGVNELAKSGIKRLQIVNKHASSSRVVLRTVLDARENTLIAGAKTVYPDRFSKLETKLQDATVAIEKGDTKEAKDLRAELIKEYSLLELSSLKENTGQQARAMIAKAVQKDADTLAPKSFRLAEEELELALNILSAGRTQTQKAQAHASKSVYFANKGIYIAEMIKNFDRHDFSDEDTILWYQQQLEMVNKPLNEPLYLDQPNHQVITGIQNKIDQVIKQKASAEISLLVANENIAALETQNTNLFQKMEGNTSSMQQQIQQIKLANSNAQARYNTIQSMFTDDEAYVFRQANNVLLETHAFDFKVGGSEIDSKNYGLLKKIIHAINVFDDPDIVIMGHTDSTGSDVLNQILSQKRAKAMSAFLQKIGKYSPHKMDIKGYGESRPVASNETKQGRARNRRIEVLIVNQ